MSNVTSQARTQEVEFVEWLIARDACALDEIADLVVAQGQPRHQCQGPKHAVCGAAGGHVLVCGHAAEELHGGAGVFTNDLVDSLVCATLARWETARLMAMLERRTV